METEDQTSTHRYLGLYQILGSAVFSNLLGLEQKEKKKTEMYEENSF